LFHSFGFGETSALDKLGAPFSFFDLVVAGLILSQSNPLDYPCTNCNRRSCIAPEQYECHFIEGCLVPAALPVNLFRRL
jgi:hypothetical protein